MEGSGATEGPHLNVGMRVVDDEASEGSVDISVNGVRSKLTQLRYCSLNI